jgi:hypothetical protein
MLYRAITYQTQMNYSYELIKYSYLDNFLTYIIHSLYLYILFRLIYNNFYFIYSMFNSRSN